MDFFCAEFCKDVNNLESRLSEDFYEIGLSGLVEDREIEISEFAVDMLAQNSPIIVDVFFKVKSL